MNDTPGLDELTTDPGLTPQAGAPGAAVATRDITPAEIEALLQPYTISMKEWLTGILTVDDFPDQDPEAVTMGMLAQILMAETSEEALAAMDLQRAKELCGGDPGGRSPVLEITGARPMKSDYDEGAACYCIVSAVVLETGEKIRFTTGARAVQTAIFKHMAQGWMPFRACLEIRRERTRSGFYPLNLVSGI